MSARLFHYTQKVMFKHCDPAGIVFYPRYFEMMNDVVESFFAECLGLPFERLLVTAGVPTVQPNFTRRRGMAKCSTLVSG